MQVYRPFKLYLISYVSSNTTKNKNGFFFLLNARTQYYYNTRENRLTTNTILY
jgi:hypothetical protein